MDFNEQSQRDGYVGGNQLQLQRGAIAEQMKCLARWLQLERVEVFCQLEKGHAGEHWAKYKYDGDEEPSGEIWWQEAQEKTTLSMQFLRPSEQAEDGVSLLRERIGRDCTTRIRARRSEKETQP